MKRVAATLGGLGMIRQTGRNPVRLQLAGGKHLKLVLAPLGDRIPPTGDRCPMNTQGPRERRLGAEIQNGFLLAHGNSKTCLTKPVKHDYARMPYGKGMGENSINERIRGRLADLDMQQVELARRVGVSKAAVSHWLDGTTKFIRPEHLVSIADALGLELRWLITGRGPRLAKDGSPMDFDNNDMDLLQAPPEVKIIFRHILAATKKAP